MIDEKPVSGVTGIIVTVSRLKLARNKKKVAAPLRLGRVFGCATIILGILCLLYLAFSAMLQK
jgi:hypothetical protein